MTIRTKLSSALLVAALVGIGVSSAPVMAGTVTVVDGTPRITIDPAAFDLSRASEQVRLQRAVKSAANKVCYVDEATDLLSRTDAVACYHRALSSANEQIAALQLHGNKALASNAGGSIVIASSK
jgi:UrcA family protein